MKAQEVKDLDEHELKAQVHEIQEQLFRFRFQMSMGHTDGLKKARTKKVCRGIYGIAPANWRRRIDDGGRKTQHKNEDRRGGVDQDG
jgi:ribosomal protein L29